MNWRHKIKEWEYFELVKYTIIFGAIIYLGISNYQLREQIEEMEYMNEEVTKTADRLNDFIKHFNKVNAEDSNLFNDLNHRIVTLDKRVDDIEHDLIWK